MAHYVEKGGLVALQDAPFLDFKVVRKDKSWVVHKTYLCGDSPALVKHCTEMREAQDGVITFNEDDPKVIEKFLTYQYTRTYNDFYTPAPGPARPWLLDRLSESTLRARYGPSIANCIKDPAMKALGWQCDDPLSELQFRYNKWTKEDFTAAFVLNIGMYGLAHRFGLVHMMQLAVKKIMSKEIYFRYCNLGQVLETIQEVTAPDDLDLGYRIFARCVVNHNVIKSDPTALKCLMSISALGWKIGVDQRIQIEQAHGNALTQTNHYVHLIEELEQANEKIIEQTGRVTTKNEKLQPLHKLNENRKKEIVKLQS